MIARLLFFVFFMSVWCVLFLIAADWILTDLGAEPIVKWNARLW